MKSSTTRPRTDSTQRDRVEDLRGRDDHAPAHDLPQPRLRLRPVMILQTTTERDRTPHQPQATTDRGEPDEQLKHLIQQIRDRPPLTTIKEPDRQRPPLTPIVRENRYDNGGQPYLPLQRQRTECHLKMTIERETGTAQLESCNTENVCLRKSLLSILYPASKRVVLSIVIS